MIKKCKQKSCSLFHKFKCVEIQQKTSFQTEAFLVHCFSLTALSCAVTLSYACRFCFFLFLVPFPFSTFLSLKHRHHLSLRGNFWSVRTPWHSGSGIRAQLLLHGFLKSPSLSAAWYVFALKVLPKMSLNPVFGVSGMAHTQECM